MKKILLIFAVLFASCFEVQVKPREVNAQSKYTRLISYNYTTSTIDGMTYGIWVADYEGSQSTYGSSIFVVNHTKDALEVALLRKQLEKK